MKVMNDFWQIICLITLFLAVTAVAEFVGEVFDDG